MVTVYYWSQTMVTVYYWIQSMVTVYYWSQLYDAVLPSTLFKRFV